MLHEELLIGSEKSASSSSVTSVINPASGQTIATVAEGTAKDADRAVAAAGQSFAGEWRRIDSRERGRILNRIAAGIREQKEELAGLESLNAGKPIGDARDEVSLAADCFEYYAGAVNKVGGDTIPVAARGVCMTFREPIGVCALIVPWNFPLAIASWKVAPALAMGNTVVLKPAELTPLTALRLGRIALEAGLPPGALNVVSGRGDVVGEALVKHPAVRKVGFTGSTAVGTRVMQLAAGDVKRVTLELGGKSANIVFADADLDRALKSAVSSSLANAGQDCCARSRILIERPLYEEFGRRLQEMFEAVRLGDPLDEKTEMGPLISMDQRERVLEHVSAGMREGAELLCGGDVPDDAALERGSFLRPAVFRSTNAGIRLVQEEIFGPVVVLMPFDSEQEAVTLANGTLYGLSGSIWTRDIGRALRVARNVETGVLSINSGSSVHLEAPFGGVKRSGVGRELGLPALDNYSELKTIFISTD